MIPLYSVDQVRDADSYAIEKLKIPSLVLMENAAMSILQAILQKYPYVDKSFRFGIICGKGNNGGDGFALARHLLINGFEVHILSLADEAQLKGDALTNFRIIKNFINDYTHSSITKYQSLRDINRLNNCEIIICELQDEM